MMQQRKNKILDKLEIHTFDLVDNSTGKEVMKYELGEDFSIETGIEFGRLYRRNNEWKFDASGVGYKEDLNFFLSKYFKEQFKNKNKNARSNKFIKRSNHRPTQKFKRRKCL
jgi:hypothetical protein